MHDIQDMTRGLRRIDRAVHELRSGYPVLIASGTQGNAWLAMSAECAVEEGQDKVLQALTEAEVTLVLSSIRAQRLGLLEQPMGDAKAVALPLPLVGNDLLAQVIDPVAGLNSIPVDADAWKRFVRLAVPEEAAVFDLTKLASLLPAVLVAPLQEPDLAAWSRSHHVLRIDVQDIYAYREALACTLRQVSGAHVPLAMAEGAKVLAFRPSYSSIEHLAIVVGEPEKEQAPLVRLHSSCVTGDILGSLRCDCGDQLKAALAAVSAEGVGVVLYLSQEGRGIGIVNKLRAYQLQDAGLDTVDANEEIGFAADERHFEPAAVMLKLLGINRIRLLTNNPQKVRDLQQYGINIAERVPLVIPANPHNERYLDTKGKRCGHLF